MINVLERKGILTSMEVLDELEVIVAVKGRGEVEKLGIVLLWSIQEIEPK